MGTTAFAIPCLERVLATGHEVIAVYTQPPRPARRGHKLQRTSMHDAAEHSGLPVVLAPSLKDADAQADFARLELDLAIVGAYGLLLPQPILAAPRLGCINLHASLLPRWRGAAPIERAIEAGDAETGVCIFQMETGLDTGPVYACERVAILPETTAGDLHASLAALAAGMIDDVLAGIAAGTLAPMPQPSEGVVYAKKLARDEGRLDFTARAVALGRKLRAFDPRPGCWCTAAGERLLVLGGEPVAGKGPPGTILAMPLTVACGDGALRITTVQRPGRRPVQAAELQRGFPLPVGTVLR